MAGSKGGITLDMTAMTDMAFLLLTFFILTAKMKTPEPVQVETPSSVSKIKLPESEIIRLTVSKEGGIYFTLSEKPVRVKVIQEVSKGYSLNLNDQEVAKLAQYETIGMPAGMLRSFLAIPDDKKVDFKQPGIPADSAKNELITWIRAAKSAGPRMKIAIKGDMESEYKAYSDVVSTLQELNLNKFSLVTNLEGSEKE